MSETESEPKKQPNAIIINELLFLASQSTEPENAIRFIKCIIENLQLCQKNRVINPDEMKELKDIEKELQESQKQYTKKANEVLMRFYATRILFFVVYLVSILIGFAYGVHNYYKGPPGSELIMTVLALIVFIIGISVALMHLGLFKFNLLPVESIEEKHQESEKKSENEDPQTDISSIMIMNQQLKLVDIYFQDVESMKKYVEFMEKARYYLKFISILPIILFFCVCIYCFLTRFLVDWNCQELIFCIVTTSMGVIIAPFVLFPI